MSTVPLQNNEAPLVPANEASLVNKDLVTFTLAPTTTAVKETFLDIGTQDRAGHPSIRTFLAELAKRQCRQRGCC